jgi:hypothetical protein
MANVPGELHFFSCLHTTLSRAQVADLYRAIGWLVRKCGRTEYEVIASWCDLVIESESPILMHGTATRALANAEELLAPLRAAGISFTADFYSADGGLLQQFRGSN